MFCGKCGKKLEEEAKFCPKCGGTVVPEKAGLVSAPPKQKGKKSPVPMIIGVIVAILMIGGVILYLMVFAPWSSSRAKSRDAVRLADLSQVRAALELYYSEEGDYPGTPDGESWSSLSVLITRGYMFSLPKDPLNNASHKYKYYPDGDNQKYILAADRFESHLHSGSLADCGSIRNVVCDCTYPILCLGPR